MPYSRLKFPLLVGVVSLVVTIAGCSTGPAIAPVSGTITDKGKPIADANVSFQPSEDKMNTGFGSYAKTDSQGRYALKMVGSDRPGAVVGRHAVRVLLPGPAVVKDDDIRAQRIKTYDFVVTKDGSAAADFDLSK